MQNLMSRSLVSRSALRLVLAGLLVGGVALTGCGPDDDNNTANNGPNNGQTGDAALTVDPSMQDFGAVGVGQTSSATSFTISNTGTGTSSAISVELAGDNASDFAIDADDCTDATLEAEATCTVDVTFSPSETGDLAATLMIAADNGGEVTATLEGAGAVGNLTVSPTPYAYGDVVVGEAASNEFTITNEGDTESGDLTANINGGDATQFSIASDDCSGSTLAVDATCTITVEYNPASTGAATTELRVVGGPEDGEGSAALNGNGVDDAELEITPPTQNFGTVVEGESSADATVTVTNDGDVESGSLAVELTGADSGEFTISADNCNGQTLGAGDDCAIFLNFSPTSTGDKTASLDVTADPGGSVSTALGGEGIAPGALSIDNSPADFGTVTVTETSNSQTFTVTNTGGSDVGPLNTSFTGSNISDFTITSNGCAGTTLSGGGACTVSVAFSPTSSGARTANLRVATGGSASVEATLNGVGEAQAAVAQFEITPASHAFGDVEVGTQSSVQTFTITNTGDEDSDVPTLALSGPNFGQFTIVGDNCSAALAGGASCTADVRFEPTSTGDRNAQLEVSASAGGTDSANLQGTGVQPADLSVSNSSLQFGNVVNNGSTTLDIVVTNGGTVDTGAISTTLTGAGFAIASDTCTGNTLTATAAGRNCTITIEFAPTTTGPASGDIEISASPGGTISVALNGNSEPEFSISPNPFDFGPIQTNNAGSSATQTFTIENTDGVGEMERDFNAAISGDADFSIPGTSTCANVQPGDTCTIDVVFNPQGAKGTRTATLDVTDDQSNTWSADLSGTAAGALVISNGNQGDFGDVPVGGSSPMDFTITNNDSSATANIEQVKLFGGDSFSIGVVDPNCRAGGAITAGGSCDVEVYFHPRATGTASASLEVISDLNDDTYDMSGNGVTGADLEVTPDTSTDFGDIAATETGSLSFTVTNNGAFESNNIAVVNPTFPGITPNGIATVTANTCIGQTLAANGGTCTFDVTAAPTPTMRASQTNDPDYEIGWSVTDGTSTDSGFLTLRVLTQLSINPTSVDFDEQVQGTTSAPQTFDITNRGTTDVTPTLEINGSNSNGYLIDSNDCTPVTAGGTCQVAIEFSPPNTGSFNNAVVDLYHDGASSASNEAGSIQAGLDGTGVIDADIEFEMDFRNFGWTVTNETGVTKTLTLVNNGGGDTGTLETTAPDPLGSNDHFSIVDNCDGQNLAPDASCTYEVTFEPTATGLQNLNIAVSAPGQTGSSGSPVDTESTTGSFTNGSNPNGLWGEGIADSGVVIVPGANEFADTVQGQTSGSFTFTVENRSQSTINSPLSVSLSPGTHFTIVDDSDCTGSGVNLGAGQSCTIDAQFSPTGSGGANYEATLEASAAGVGTGETRLQGTALPRADLDWRVPDPTEVAENDDFLFLAAFFGLPDRGTFLNVPVGETRTGVVRYENSGTQNSGAVSMAITGPSAGQFSVVQNDCSSGVGAGQTCDVFVEFTPAATAFRAEAVLEATPTNGTAVDADLDGAGVTPADLSITPTGAQDCGDNVYTGDSSTCSNIYTLSNAGGEPSGDIDFDLPGDNFTVQGILDNSLSGEACDVQGGQQLAAQTSIYVNNALAWLQSGGTEPLTLPQACDFVVIYQPQTVGSHSDTLTVTADPGATGGITRDVNGDAIASLELTSTTSPVSLAAPVGSNDAVTLTFTNQSLSPTGALGVELTGANRDEFSITSTAASTCGGQSLGGLGSTCDVRVTFTPDTVSPGKTATLTVTDGSAEKTVTVEFDATGQNP